MPSRWKKSAAAREIYHKVKKLNFGEVLAIGCYLISLAALAVFVIFRINIIKFI